MLVGILLLVGLVALFLTLFNGYFLDVLLGETEGRPPAFRRARRRRKAAGTWFLSICLFTLGLDSWSPDGTAWVVAREIALAVGPAAALIVWIGTVVLEWRVGRSDGRADLPGITSRTSGR
jgi:hypothetical protein